jgi:hypothetical protein
MTTISILTAFLSLDRGESVMLLIPLFLAGYFVLVWVFQMLWNWTMPQVFRLRAIGYWQAFRILLITDLIFGPGSWIRFGR